MSAAPPFPDDVFQLVVDDDDYPDTSLGTFRYPDGNPAPRAPLDLSIDIDEEALEFIYASARGRLNLNIDCSRHGRWVVLDDLELDIHYGKSGRLRPCRTCSCLVPIRETGRPARFCCPACRQAAYRQSKEGADSPNQLRRSTVTPLAVPATLPTNWDYVWTRLFKQLDRLHPWERFGLLSADQVLDVPLVWQPADRRDGEDWIIYEVLHRAMGRLRIRYNDQPASDYPRSLLFGESGSEALTLDLAIWPPPWERRSAVRHPRRPR